MNQWKMARNQLSWSLSSFLWTLFYSLIQEDRITTRVYASLRSPHLDPQSKSKHSLHFTLLAYSLRSFYKYQSKLSQYDMNRNSPSCCVFTAREDEGFHIYYLQPFALRGFDGVVSEHGCELTVDHWFLCYELPQCVQGGATCGC